MSSKKIIIIEDNPVNLKLAKDILEAEGYEVFSAIDGISGFKLALEKYKEINLVLLDLKLPDINGIEIIKKLKSEKKTRNIPIIVISAHAMEADIKNSMDAGSADYITKPINIKEFLDRVRLVV